MRIFSVPEGMPRSIFENKYSRRKSDGTFQNWEERVTEVVAGNFSLDPHADPEDYQRTLDLAVAGVMPFSGRHLQHGDLDQADKLGESFTNCSTALFSFVNFWLLLKGSGVGRCYDSDLCRVNWDCMPNVRFVIDGPDLCTGEGGHPDYQDWIESVEEARHKYDSESEMVRWFEVEDSAEGWTKVVEILETAAWQGKHKDKLYLFDFTLVRGRGVPIRGQQGRPASGPIPFIKAMYQVCSIKGAGMKPWKQAMYVDHYLADCVAMGGIRRSARIAVKSWRDRDVIEFIDIKRGGWLHTANNSVGLDEEFWEKAQTPAPSHARRVFEAMCSAGYFDNTGEPGFLNLHNMVWSNEGRDAILPENLLCGNGSRILHLHPKTLEMMGSLLQYAKGKRFPFLCNPCVPLDTWVLTKEGPLQVSDLLEKPFEAIVDGRPYPATAFTKTGTQTVFKVKTSRGQELRLTGNHKVKVQRGGPTWVQWVEAENLIPGDDLVVGDHRALEGWSGSGGTFEQGWLVGSVVGTGGHDPSKHSTYIRFRGESQEQAVLLAYTRAQKGYSSLGLPGYCEHNAQEGYVQFASAELTLLCEKYLTTTEKGILAGRESLEKSSFDFYRGFFQGWFDAEGFVYTPRASVRLAPSSTFHLRVAQRMLARLGILSTIRQNLTGVGGTKRIRNARGDYQTYMATDFPELVIPRAGLSRFAEVVGFGGVQQKQELSAIMTDSPVFYPEGRTSQVVSVEPDGVEDVYDCTVEKVHEFDANGIQVHNCGEIILAVWGGYCIIGDICLANAESLDEVLDAARLMAPFLMRTNTMKFLYKAEVKRTNRIGVGITGIHEFAYRHFGYNFWDLLDEKVSRPFWEFLVRMRHAVEESATSYAAHTGVAVPHTMLTVKPSGTISKVMVCTEGAHLSAYLYLVRWVQYNMDAPEVEAHRLRGYPIKDISQQYPGRVVVGFPTKLPIADLMGGDVVCAGDPTPAQHYHWIHLLEKYWLGEGTHNQISYSLKYNPRTLRYEDYMRAILDNQGKVRACALMPQSDESAHAYLPEEAVSREVYNKMCESIQRFDAEAYDDVHLSCEGGACPIEPDRYESVS